MKNKHQYSAQQWLDHRSEELGKKHSRTLLDMTDQALNSASRKNIFELSQPTLAWTFSVLLVMGVMFNVYDQASLKTEPKIAALPAWVSDTQVPVPVIEQLKFYTWLAQHIEENNETRHEISKNQASKNYVARVYKLGARQQLASLDTP